MIETGDTGGQGHRQTDGDKAARTPLLGRFAKAALLLLGVLLFISAIFTWKTDDAMTNLPFLQQKGAAGALVARQRSIVDETPWETAQAVAALAVTQEEMSYAREAERLADHEVDQAFATALRRANLRQRTLTGEALAMQQKVTSLEALVVSDQASVKDLAAKGGDDEDVAQAQLGLDQDELSDAREDLARASGDERGEIQQELTARQAEMKKFDASAGTGEVAVISVQRYRTLEGLIEAWGKQRSRQELLLQAKSSAEQEAGMLTREHNGLEAKSTKQGRVAGAAAMAASERVAGLKRMGLERQLMSIYDDRIATEEQSAAVYGKWAAQVLLQHRIVEHLILVQGMVIAVILIIAIL